SRSRNDLLLYSLFETDIRVAGALGAQVPDRGETSEQRVARADGSPGNTQCQGLLQDLVVPRCLVVRMQHHVRVSFDEARHERRSGERDLTGAGWHLDARAWANGHDLLATHQHDPARPLDS